MSGHILGKSCSFGKNVFSLLRLFVVLVDSNFGFEGGNLVLIVPVPGHCLPSTFCYISWIG